MEIKRSDWNKYIKMLSDLDGRAADLAEKYIEKHGFGNMKALVDYVYALVEEYGGAASALAAEMYDATSLVEKAMVPPAEPAPTPEYGEVAKTMYGIHKTSENPNEYSGAVGRMVKRQGADTTLQNALRDGAEFAWVPNGDTCPFCITLASRGWQKMSKDALVGGHAEHIHSHCDCTYAVRQDGRSTIEGYDPEVYRQQYYGAEGDTPQERLNYMRRQQYAVNKDYINAQKRKAYKVGKALKSDNSERIINIKKGLKPTLTPLLEEYDKEKFADLLQQNPNLLGQFNPISFKRELEKRGFDVKPLGRGHHKNQPFENGGGYKVNYRGDGIIEYHPAKDSRHGGRYYKLSDAEHGKRWFDMQGHEFYPDVKQNNGRS